MQGGDVYLIVKQLRATNRKTSYTIGSTVTVVAYRSDGWLCMDEFGVSVWDNIPSLLARGYIRPMCNFSRKRQKV